jgi:hypothetical protein
MEAMELAGVVCRMEGDGLVEVLAGDGILDPLVVEDLAILSRAARAGLHLVLRTTRRGILVELIMVINSEVTISTTTFVETSMDTGGPLIIAGAEAFSPVVRVLLLRIVLGVGEQFSIDNLNPEQEKRLIKV